MSALSTVVASGADARYGFQLLNLIGSLQANSNTFDRVVAFDLGLTSRQRRWLAAVSGVEVRRVPPFVPHWNRGFTWKPWAWMNVECDAVLWVDAGATILRSLAPILEQICERGYFLVSQGNAVADIVPSSFFDLYHLPHEYADRPYAAAGILGFRREGRFFQDVLVPTYEDCVRGRNLGFSADEVTSKNVGLGAGPVDVVHDCPQFRWDQSVLNVHLLRAMPEAPLADLDEFGGWRSPHDHPRQLIWHHRRRGSLRYLKRLRIAGPKRLGWFLVAIHIQLRWWRVLHGRVFEGSLYVLKARQISRGMLARFAR